jgi:hypothetical protein
MSLLMPLQLAVDLVDLGFDLAHVGFGHAVGFGALCGVSDSVNGAHRAAAAAPRNAMMRAMSLED